ncbi:MULTISPECIES: hypothetical protein [Bacillus amyloliquefaciens group]|uniref:hypothetical protein n=1 Tax=Bacillus amyloliquefaciens group TaxID=1938374 RepID=UPI001374B54D|nr:MULTISPECIES: hypothetical protein [Bacillus amyloliquefaciens group]MCO6398346.1 hypothetical protein [Bacillus velezensis]
MFNVSKAIKEMSKESATVVDNSILNGVGEILNGLNVDFTTAKIDRKTTKLRLD